MDNLLGLIYFPLISWLGAPYDENGKEDNIVDDMKKNIENGVENNIIDDAKGGIEDTIENSIKSSMETSRDINIDTVQNVHINTNIDNNEDEMEKFTSSLALAFSIASISDQISLQTGFPTVPISTLITVIIATIFPEKIKSVIPPGELLGKLFLLFFFASVGNASGTVKSTFAAKGAIYLVCYELILYITHLTVIFGIGRNIFKIPMPDILLASNANIGNAATASSLATAKGWKNRILPSILVGTLGNAFGTFMGLSIGSFVLKKMAGY